MKTLNASLMSLQVLYPCDAPVLASLRCLPQRLYGNLCGTTRAVRSPCGPRRFAREVRWRGMPGTSLPRRDGLGFQKSALMLGHGTTSCNGACRASPLHAPCSMRPRVLRAHSRCNRGLTVTQPTLQSLVNSEAHVRDREIDKLKQVLRRWALWAIHTFAGWLRWARRARYLCIHRPRGVACHTRTGAPFIIRLCVCVRVCLRWVRPCAHAMQCDAGRIHGR